MDALQALQRLGKALRLDFELKRMIVEVVYLRMVRFSICLMQALE